MTMRDLWTRLDIRYPGVPPDAPPAGGRAHPALHGPHGPACRRADPDGSGMTRALLWFAHLAPAIYGVAIVLTLHP